MQGVSVIESVLMDREGSTIGNLVSVPIVGCIAQLCADAQDSISFYSLATAVGSADLQN